MVSIEEKITFFNDNLIPRFDVHATIRSPSGRRHPAPWLTPTIRRMMRMRDYASGFMGQPIQSDGCLGVLYFAYFTEEFGNVRVGC